MDASRRLRDLQSQPGNKICVDCSQKNPQWASISYGVFMCLECSGKHRGLGVHISFVRSVTMDSWSEIQLRKMELGGNANLNTFLSKYGISKETDIVTKYNTNAASVFRDKIQSLAEGKPWRDPPVVKETLKGGGAGGGNNNNNRKPPLSGGAGTRVDNSGWDSWDNFDDGTSHHNNNNNLRRNQSVGDFRSGSGGGGGGVRGGNGTPPARSQSTQNIFSQSQLEASAANKEDFFARKKAANEMRPDGIPPSQGGKYVGFGSSSAPVPRSASQGDVLSAVTQVIDDYKVNETVSVVTAKTTEIGQKTWGIMKGVMALASQKVEEFTKEGSSGWQINESEKIGQYQEFGKQQSNGRHSSSFGAQPSSNRQQFNSVSSGSSWDDWGDSKDNKKEESRKEAATSHTDSWAGWDDKDDDDDDDDGFETSYQTVSNTKVTGYNEKSDAKWTGGGFR